jgi:aminoglycoside phosphotransferase (APT) family kinase protein
VKSAAALARWLARASGAAGVEIGDLRLLPDGAVQENWRLEARFAGGALAGEQLLVLRRDAASALGMGLGRADEFAVLRAVHAAGIGVPEPLLLCEDRAVIGRPFFVMRFVAGEAHPGRIVSGALGGDRGRLVARLAQELARLQTLTPAAAGLAVLGLPPADPARAALEACAAVLAADGAPHPVAEWGIRWLERHLPAPASPVLCHGDFRTGNFLADGAGLTALLDWEFAHWGDAHEDLAWFCLGCWRFGAYAREAGGIAGRAAFYRAYEAASGRTVDAARARWWEVLAALRWLVIALRQRDRCLVAGERSLDLALSGKRPAECEFEILALTGAA